MASLAEPLQGGPYPDPDDDNDIPNDLRQIVEWAASRSVMRFTDEAERDSLLPTPTEGQLCVTNQGTALQVWVYANSDWREVLVGDIPGGHLQAAGNESIPTATVTTLTLGTTVALRGGMSIGTSGLVVPRDGWYTATASVRWASNSSGTRQVRIRLNGTDVMSRVDTNMGTGTFAQTCSLSTYCEAGDEFAVACWQSTGGGLNTAAGIGSPHLSVVWNGA